MSLALFLAAALAPAPQAQPVPPPAAAAQPAPMPTGAALDAAIASLSQANDRARMAEWINRFLAQAASRP